MNSFTLSGYSGSRFGLSECYGFKPARAGEMRLRGGRGLSLAAWLSESCGFKPARAGETRLRGGRQGGPAQAAGPPCGALGRRA